MAEEEKVTTPAAQTTPTSGAQTPPEGETKELNTFQKFFTELFSGKKEEPPKADEKPKAEESAKVETKTYTQEEVTAQLEAEKQKWAEEQKEQERLSKLSPEEREKASASATAAENAKLMAEITRRDLKQDAVAALSKDGYPLKLAELVNYTDKERMQASLATVTETFKEAVAQGVHERLRGKTPAGLGGAASSENMLRDTIARNIRGGI